MMMTMERKGRRRMAEEALVRWGSVVVNNVLVVAVSNPLYFSYFLFFSPYIFKLFSFLSPLFLTTALLLLALLTTTATLSPSLEDSEVYQIVFHHDHTSIIASTPEEEEEEVVKETCSEEYCRVVEESVLDKCLVVLESNVEDVVVVVDETTPAPAEESLLWFLEGERVKEESTEVSAVDCDEKSEQTPKAAIISCFASPEWESEAVKSGVDVDGYSPASGGGRDLGSYGSMRKEQKEWRRTLACKLFEERHNGGGGEGMDLLWETYESDHQSTKVGTTDNKKMRRNSTKSSSMNSSKGSSVTKKKSNNKESSVIDHDHNDHRDHHDHDHDRDEDEDYDDETNAQLCCLQALKFSAGKMGRPNFVKFSKAIKGFGWIQNVTRHAKKRSNS